MTAAERRAVSVRMKKSWAKTKAKAALDVERYLEAL